MSLLSHKVKRRSSVRLPTLPCATYSYILFSPLTHPPSSFLLTILTPPPLNSPFPFPSPVFQLVPSTSLLPPPCLFSLRAHLFFTYLLRLRDFLLRLRDFTVYDLVHLRACLVYELVYEPVQSTRFSVQDLALSANLLYLRVGPFALKMSHFLQYHH